MRGFKSFADRTLIDFDNGVTLMNYEGVENQLAPIFVDFRINNLGGDAPFGASMNISHDELLFSLDSQQKTEKTIKENRFKDELITFEIKKNDKIEIFKKYQFWPKDRNLEELDISNRSQN